MVEELRQQVRLVQRLRRDLRLRLALVQQRQLLVSSVWRPPKSILELRAQAAGPVAESRPEMLGLPAVPAGQFGATQGMETLEGLPKARTV